MPKKANHSKIFLGILITVTMAMTGCGQNVFKGLTNVATDDIVAQSDAVIANPNATPPRKTNGLSKQRQCATG